MKGTMDLRDIERRPSPIIEMTCENMLTYERSGFDSPETGFIKSPDRIQSTVKISQDEDYKDNTFGKVGQGLKGEME